MQVQSIKGRPVFYPWEKWSNGKKHIAKFNRDFFCSVESFKQALRRYSRDNGIEVASENIGIDGVRFQFTKKPRRM